MSDQAAPDPAAGHSRRPRHFDRLSDRSRQAADATPVPEPVEETERAAYRLDLPHELRHREPLPLILLAVFAAGVLGTAARLTLDALIPAAPGGIPLSTLLINTAGSFALGIVVTAVPHHAPEWLRAALTTGLLGAFTTFSAITVASAALTDSGEPLSAGILLVVSIVAGVPAAAAGMALGGVVGRRRP